MYSDSLPETLTGKTAAILHTFNLQARILVLVHVEGAPPNICEAPHTPTNPFYSAMPSRKWDSSQITACQALFKAATLLWCWKLSTDHHPTGKRAARASLFPFVCTHLIILGNHVPI